MCSSFVIYSYTISLMFQTALLHCIMSEIPIVSGNLFIHGQISYSSQKPWIFSGSIRQNILFGDHFDKTRYWKVIEVCSLLPDIVSFEHSDHTLVGDRGVILSGMYR
jgi:ATP-binding cassette subfamily C (CFTR/MRP) protein 4